MTNRLWMLDAKVEVPRGMDGFWSIIRQLDAAGPWTIADVDKQTNVKRGEVFAYCKRLAAGGYIEPIGERKHPREWFKPSILFRVLKPVETPPRLAKDGTELPEPKTETIWRTMKMLRTFTAREIAAVVAPDSPDRQINTVRSYLYFLARVSVVARIDGGKNKGKAGGGTTEARFRLVQNLGGQAPRVLATRLIYDPNAHRIIGSALGREEAR